MIEDDVRAAMRAHEHEAPTAAGFTPAARQRGPIALIVSAAVVGTILLATAIVVLASRDGKPDRATAALSCPTAIPRSTADAAWVPALPRGIDGSDRLAPDRAPSRVVICEFGPTSRGGELSGTRVLTRGLDAVRETLTWAPKAVGHYWCAGVGGQESDVLPQFLVGLSYGGASMWVSAPAGCPIRPSTNGRFDAAISVASYARTAYSTGSWPTTAIHAGRHGQERAVVPGSPTSLTIASARGATRTVTTGFRDLIDALNDAPSTPSRHGCGPSGPRLYTLTFHYARGPDVSVEFSRGCFPEVDNGSLQIRTDSAFLPAIRALLG